MSAAVVVFGAEAALEDAAAVVEGDVVLRVPDADLVAPAAVFVDFVPPVDFVVELERAGFPLDVLPAAVFDDEPVAPALLDAVVFAAVCRRLRCSERYSRSMISLSSLSTTSPRPSPTISLRSPSSLQIRPWVCDGVRTASKQQDRYERSGRSSVHPHSCRLRHSRRRRRHRLDDHWSSRRGSVLRGRVPGPSSCVQPRLTPRFAISSAASRYESAPLECGSYEITVCP